MIKIDSRLLRIQAVLLGIAAAAVAFWLTTLHHGSSESSDPSYVGCSAIGGTDSVPSNPNIYSITGSNLNAVTCSLRRGDTIDWVTWYD